MVRKSIKEQLAFRKTLSAPLRFITSPLLTVGLGTILGGLSVVAGAPILGTTIVGGGLKTGLATGGALTGTTLLASSPTTRKALKAKVLTPAAIGVSAGEGIETILERGKKTVKKVKDVFADVPSPLKKGAAVAAIGGGVLAAGAAIAPRLRAALPSTSDIFATPPIATAALQPLAPVKQPVEEPTLVVSPAPQKPITIKNTFNPTIDIRFKKSKKFINQQNIF